MTPIVERFRIPIWLTTLIVIVMILLFSLIIYDAREREMIEQFNRQQLVIAKGIASAVEDLIIGVERNIKSNMLLRDSGKGSLPAGRDLTFFYRGLEGKAEFIARKKGRTVTSYPAYFSDRLDGKIDSIIREVERSGETYVGHVTDPLRNKAETGGDLPSEFIIVATPELNSDKKISSVLFAAVSLSTIVQRYIETAKFDFSCDTWVIDEHGTIIYHPAKKLIRMDASVLEKYAPPTVPLKDLMLRLGAGYGFFKLQDGDKIRKMIVAYAPIRLNMSQWSIAVATPYQIATGHMKRTYYMIMTGALFLICAVMVGSLFTVRSGKKQIRLEEELKHLRAKSILQEKLAVEKHMVEGIIEGSPIPMFVINRDHRIIKWNKACADLTGYSSADMIGTDKQSLPLYGKKRPLIADLIVDGDIEGLDHYYGKKKVQRSSVIEGAFEASDLYENLGGKPRYLYFLAAPILDEKGEIIAAIETLQDVSREKNMELNLKESVESLKDELDVNINLRKGIEELYTFFQSVVNSSPDKIYVLDSNGIINYVSRGFEGPDMSKVKGVHLEELVEPSNRELVMRKWDEGQRGIFTPYEMEVTAKDGTKRNLLISVTPIRGTDKFIIVQRNITEFKNLEKKVYESQRLAAVGQLSAGIAHEVRNPLSSIKMSLQILKKRLNPQGNDLKRFQIAEKEVEHLEKLVSDILIFARPAEPELKRTDLHAVIEQSLLLAEKELADKKILAKVERGPGIPPLEIDGPKLSQALLNIILNAIDAMAENGRLTISTCLLDSEGKKSVEIAVADNGCGIDQEDLPHIFNPFFTRKSYGTGLGLSQVKKMIDLHAGSIEIFSRKGEGTRVVITLPAGLGAAGVAGLPQPASISPAS